MTIRTYWWRGGGGKGNFGDMLGPAILQALSGQPIERCSIEQSDILAIGSLLEQWFWPQNSWESYRGFVWGVGRMFGKTPLRLPRAKVLAVRGDLSRQSLGVATQEVFLGDPGLLCPHLHHPIRQPKYKLGVWPHWSEAKNAKLRAFVDSSPDILLIDPCAGIRETLDRAASCEAIASSSLHGLITADALLIPNCWLRLETGKEDEVGMPLFKYLDYFSAYQSPPPTPYSLSPTTRLDDVLAQATSERHSTVSKLQEQLLAVFPFKR